jgi:hypothetical protein
VAAIDVTREASAIGRDERGRVVLTMFVTYWPFDVFVGGSVASLTKVGTPSSGGSSVIQATAGQTYYVGVGCSGYDCYMPFRMTVGPPG